MEVIVDNKLITCKASACVSVVCVFTRNKVNNALLLLKQPILNKMTVKELKEVCDKLEEKQREFDERFTKVENGVDETKLAIQKFDLSVIEATVKKAVQESNESHYQKLEESSALVLRDVAAIRRTVNDHLIQRNVTLARENRDLRSRVGVMEKRLGELEQLVNNIDQNARKSNIEISGIPEDIDQAALPSTVAKILNSVANTDVAEHDIEACHRLRSNRQGPKVTIVRAKRNVLDQLRMKDNRSRDKMNAAAAAAELPRTTKLYVNDNQSKNMKMIAYNARQLAEAGLIDSTWWYNASVRIKTLADDFINVTHESQLYKLAPEFRGFTFDTSFCERLCHSEDRLMMELDDLDGMNWNESPLAASNERV